MPVEELLRRLALNDDKVVRSAVGAARLVAAAPRLALAIDCDLESADEARNGP